MVPDQTFLGEDKLVVGEDAVSLVVPVQTLPPADSSVDTAGLGTIVSSLRFP